MTKIRGTKSDSAKRLAKANAKEAAELEAQKAKEASKAREVAEMKQWMALFDSMTIEGRKQAGLARQPPSIERLKAMANRFHMATSSDDDYERMYIELLLNIIDRLDDDSRNQFNIFFAELQKVTNG